jgi:hypothetical protein
MNDKKKSETTDLEKILLGTASIQFMANALQQVRRHYQFLLHNRPDDEVLRESLAQQTAQITRTMKHVRKAAEELANYLNNHDIVDDELLYATSASFDLMYGRPVPEK